MEYDLNEDDITMRSWGPRLRDDLCITEAASLALATSIFNEVRGLREKLSQEPLSGVVSLAHRLNEVALFMNYLADRQAGGNVSVLEQHSHVVLSSYICFVYLGDACFTRLRKIAPNGSISKRCCKFLTENPVRAFRNAVAHANWLVEDNRVVFWARKGRDKNEPLEKFIVHDSDRAFWFFLSLCVAKATYAALTMMEHGSEDWQH
jgi:hypothetical protein